MIGYIRVSTDEQGISLDAQEEAIRRYAAFKGVALRHVVRDEGVSGGTPLSERPGGQTLLSMLPRRRQRDVPSVVSTKLDRLFRSALDCLTCVESWQSVGVALHLLDMNLDTSTPMGKCFLTNVAAFAEMERALIRERTVTALAQKKSRGERISGRLPVGMRLAADGVHLEVDPDQQRVIQRAKTLRADDRSFDWIARKLRAEGFHSVANGEMAARLCGAA